MDDAALKRYSGPLSLDEALEGINACRRNARRLLKDAENLFAERRLPTALLLSILAIEEAGKGQHIRRILTSTTDDERKRAWKALRRHTAKNGMWFFRSYMDHEGGDANIHNLWSLVGADTDLAKLAELIKQTSTYVDRYGEELWSEPENVVEEGTTRSFLEAAKAVVPTSDWSKREMELWLEHLVPAAGTDRFTQAARAWSDAMIAEGLRPTESGAVWRRFLGLNDDP